MDTGNNEITKYSIGEQLKSVKTGRQLSQQDIANFIGIANRLYQNGNRAQA